jgi:hypothetical protein
MLQVRSSKLCLPIPAMLAGLTQAETVLFDVDQIHELDVVIGFDIGAPV